MSSITYTFFPFHQFYHFKRCKSCILKNCRYEFHLGLYLTIRLHFQEDLVKEETINKLMKPKSLAVIGASAKPGKIGYTVIKNLIESGYEGKVYPINPEADEILGLKVYKTLAEVPGTIDSAVITIPAKAVMQAVEECGQKGVKGLIIITSGFSETGNKGSGTTIGRIGHTARYVHSRTKHCGYSVQLGQNECLLRALPAFTREGFSPHPKWRSADRHRCLHLHPRGRFR